eukprot:TRINITY_DN1346_c0_g1_i2.p1 TRINITY_DN1346_c0_g1~~TRINITY_DN1346_c0_g1_i2.p1  ORF type:complete len:688 (-),score=102.72 TRINITY_DN1346_c0_g1_i2:86-2149(-)
MHVKCYTGVYGSMCGPTYETPHEVRAGRTMGLSAFGMSTVPEVLAAKSAGMEIFAVSLVTNMAAGIIEETLTHEAVQQVADEAGPMFVRFMKELIGGLVVKEIAAIPVPHSAEHAPSTSTILPQPGAVPATTEEIHEALAKIVSLAKSQSEKEDASEISVAYFLPQGHDEEFLKRLTDAHKISYGDIPHFPKISASGRNGALVIGRLEGSQVCALVHNQLEGFACEEAVFASQILTRLGVRVLVHSFQAEKTDGGSESEEHLVLFSDVAEVTTIHPTPQDQPLLQYLPNVSPVSFKKYGDKVIELGKKADVDIRMGAYLAYTAPCFPTPSERVLAKFSQASYYGITNTSLVYTCAASKIDVVALATIGPVTPVVEKRLAELLVTIAEAASHISAKPREAAQADASKRFKQRQIGYALTNQVKGGVTQGDYSKTAEAVEFVKNKLKNKSVARAVVLEGGLTEAIEGVQHGEFISGIPHMPEDLRIAEVKAKEDGQSFLVVDRMYYLNEGRVFSEIVAPIRLLGMLGIKSIHFAARICSVVPSLRLNDLVLLQDHINFSGRNPLFGPNEEKWGVRFPDMGDAYSAELAAQARDAAKAKSIELKEASFGLVVGPVFSCALTANFAVAVDVQALCTTLAPEVIVCKHMGIKACAVGIVCGTIVSGQEGETGDGTVSHEAIQHLRSLFGSLH